MNTTKVLNKNVSILQRVSCLRERILQETTHGRDGAYATPLISLYIHCVKRPMGNGVDWDQWSKTPPEPWDDCW
ncbi:MAG: hypothetical protein JO202_02830 [Ktedonobacteraceae bacterium]|nr:hypothetical protein [Ktedonobacteraceae bacterium]